MDELLDWQSRGEEGEAKTTTNSLTLNLIAVAAWRNFLSGNNVILYLLG